MTTGDEPTHVDDHPAADLRGRTARGAKVVLLGQIARILLQFASVVVLARLLTPGDYGLFAFAVAIISFGEVFRDFGLSTAAIQSPTLSRGQRTNLFWVNLGLGVVLAALCWVIAPLLTRATGHEASSDLARAMSVVFVLNGALAQYRADLNRRMRYTALTVSDVGGTLLGVVTAIVAASAGWGYWALAIQQVAGVTAILVFSMIAAGWLPGLPDRHASVRPFARFGIGMVGTQIVGYGNNYADTLTIGLRFGPVELGVYNRAYQVLMVTLNQLRNPTTTVALPLLARLDVDDPRTDEVLVRGQAALGYTLVAMTAFAAGAAKPIIDLALGPGWEQAVPLFAILSISGAAGTVGFVAYWVFLARALTGRLFAFSILTLVIRVGFVLIGSFWGVVGVAWGCALAPLLTLPMGYHWLSRYTHVPLRALNIGAARILSCAVVAAAATYAVQQAAASLPSFVQLVLCGLATVGAYALMALVVPVIRRDLIGVMRFGRAALRRG